MGPPGVAQALVEAAGGAGAGIKGELLSCVLRTCHAVFASKCMKLHSCHQYHSVLTEAHSCIVEHQELRCKVSGASTFYSF